LRHHVKVSHCCFGYRQFGAHRCGQNHYHLLTWWWPTYKAETCSCCILCSVAYYIVILSDILLCFLLHEYVNTHIIIYSVLLNVSAFCISRSYQSHLVPSHLQKCKCIYKCRRVGTLHLKIIGDISVMAKFYCYNPINIFKLINSYSKLSVWKYLLSLFFHRNLKNIVIKVLGKLINYMLEYFIKAVQIINLTLSWDMHIQNNNIMQIVSCIT
jgi:hypothetical protein